jgi:hypothetical protein
MTPSKVIPSKVDQLRNETKITAKNSQDDVDVPKMHLVPSRWERTGWKYTEVDPMNTSFFKNPNRVNCHGASPKAADTGDSSVFGGKRNSYIPKFNAESTY